MQDFAGPSTVSTNFYQFLKTTKHCHGLTNYILILKNQLTINNHYQQY